MTKPKYEPQSSELFRHFDKFIAEFPDEFTFLDYIRFIYRYKESEGRPLQHTYVALLVKTADRPIPFDAAHQEIGRQLKKFAEENGYQRVDARPAETLWSTETQDAHYQRM